MARLGLIPLDRMTPEQRRLNDMIAGKRVGSQTRGPYGILLHVPKLCERVVGVADYLRDDASVPRPVVEVAVLTIGTTISCTALGCTGMSNVKVAGIGRQPR